MDILGYHIPGLVGVTATFASVYTAFAKFDADQSDENRAFVREWLLGFKADDRHWAQFFKELFAKVFGERHLSAKCIGRSALFSGALLAAIWSYRYLHSYLNHASFYFPLAIAIVWTALAMVADYFSLWKTRVLLTRTSLLDNGLAALAVVIGDAFATIVISVLTIYSFPLLFVAPKLDLLWQAFLFAFSWPHLENSDRGIARLLFLAPLLTSAWLWMYLVVAYAMRAANYLPSWLRPLSKVMDLESHPARTIGYVAATVSAMIVGIMTLI